MTGSKPETVGDLVGLTISGGIAHFPGRAGERVRHFADLDPTLVAELLTALTRDGVDGLRYAGWAVGGRAPLTRVEVHDGTRCVEAALGLPHGIVARERGPLRTGRERRQGRQSRVAVGARALHGVAQRAVALEAIGAKDTVEMCAESLDGGA